MAKAKLTQLKKCCKCTGPLEDTDIFYCKKCVRHDSVDDDNFIRCHGFKIRHRPNGSQAKWVYLGPENLRIGLFTGREYRQEDAYRLACLVRDQAMIDMVK